MVDAEPLPVVLDLEAAIEAGSPAARVTEMRGGGDGGAGAHGAGGGDEDEPAFDSPNVAANLHLSAGDAAAGLARSDAVVSGRFRTSWVHQAYLEPQSTLAWVEPDGELVVSSSTQGAFMARQGLSPTCSGCRWTASACRPRRSAAASAAS